MPPNRFQRRRPIRQRRRVFVIATEGKETEKVYFEAFKGDRFRQNIHVEILPTPNGRSSPRAVLTRLQKYVRDYQIDLDELWVVIDVDQWGKDAIDEVCRKCAEKGFNVAVSNPCFEFWLVMHQEHPPTPSTLEDCKKALKRQLGTYDKSRYDPEKLIPHVRLAISHARRLDMQADEPWPRNPGTHVYKLVEKLLDEPK